MEGIIPYEEKRPWGGFRQFVKNEEVTVKIITVKAGEGTSLQKHSGRSEFWRILSGEPTVTIGNSKYSAKKSDEFFIPQGEMHRIEGGEEDAELLEISLGQFDEDDIVRLEDKYGRS